MAKLSNISRRRVLSALRSLGFEIDTSRGTGSHAMVFHPTEPERCTTLANKDPVPKGTLRKMLSDLRLTRTEFQDRL
ncbi:MAG: type II toxin-antitoxin system HicA family toxin [Planctomycetota bacterium]